MLFFETSALTGYNVENLFVQSSAEILKKIDEGTYEVKDEV